MSLDITVLLPIFCLLIGKPSLFLSQPPLYSVELTDTATLGCFALGENISYHWIVGSGLFPSKDIGINDSTLVIPDVRSSDENTYTCLATTQKECILSKATQLIVTGMIIMHNVCNDKKLIIHVRRFAIRNSNTIDPDR